MAFGLKTYCPGLKYGNPINGVDRVGESFSEYKEWWDNKRETWRTEDKKSTINLAITVMILLIGLAILILG